RLVQCAATQFAPCVLHRRERVAGQQIGERQPAREAEPLETEEPFVFSAPLFEISPTFRGTLPAVMQDGGLRLEEQPPTRAHDAQTPFGILAVHVEALVKAA